MGYFGLDQIKNFSPIYIWNYAYDTIVPGKKPAKTIQTISQFPVDKMNLAKASGNLFIRVAGLSGAIAVIMGAYGNHVFFKRQDVPNEMKEVFKTGNYYHFLHTLALLAIPLTRRPKVVGTLMTSGMLLFSGSCYAYSLTGQKEMGKLAPFGGFLLIFAWLSMMF